MRKLEHIYFGFRLWVISDVSCNKASTELQTSGASQEEKKSSVTLTLINGDVVLIVNTNGEKAQVFCVR